MPIILVQIDHPTGKSAARILKQLACRFLDDLHLDAVEVSLVVTTDRKIRKINREWRKKDEATDVLSFPSDIGPLPPAGARPLGDIVISLDTARKRAREEKQPLTPELARYLAHGLLHLLGHDHHNPKDAERMAAMESQLLGGAGMVGASLNAKKPCRGR